MTATAKLPLKESVEHYAPGEDIPLVAYGGFVVGFGAALGGAILGLRAAGRELPQRPAAADVLLAGAATHKISRLLARGKVTAALRAPFTRLEDRAGYAELDEAPRGSGLRRAIGELLVCPYCLGSWISAGFGVGMVAAPRTTRFVAGIYAAEAISDFLQVAYNAAESRA